MTIAKDIKKLKDWLCFIDDSEFYKLFCFSFLDAQKIGKYYQQISLLKASIFFELGLKLRD